MDSQIPHEIIHRRRRKRIIRIAVYAGTAITLFIVLISVLRGGIKASSINISVADRGPLEITVSSSGKVVPLYEEVITSPIPSKVLDVYKKSGESLQKNDLILKLDLTAANADFERLRNEFEMKKSKIAQQEANAQTQLSEMAMQIRIDSMRLQRSQVQLSNERYLDSIGASTIDKIRQAELELEVLALQYEQLKLKYTNLQKNIQADMRVANLDLSIAQKNFDLVSKTMGDAQVRAPRTATLTWVNDQIGSNVSQGAQLAIVSDLNHFKVEAEIADSYANKVLPGNKAVVEIGDDKLTGLVGNVAPAVVNGIIKFTVTLDQNDNPKLRSGLKADVYVINSIKESALRIANRLYYHGPGKYEMWVVKNSVAKKRTVVLGESSYEHVEVLDGLNEGDMVIVNDLSRFKSKTKLRIKD